jgi:anti-sigma regulatory factor (Ser/Thr protein kinase)
MAGGEAVRSLGRPRDAAVVFGVPAPVRALSAHLVLAVAISTCMVATVALFNLREVSSSALTYDGFRLSAAALFLAAGILRLRRWNLTLDLNSGLMSGAFFVIGVLSLPLDNLAGQIVATGTESGLSLVTHAVGSLVAVWLVHRGLTVDDPRQRAAAQRFGLGPLGFSLGALAVTVVVVTLLSTDPARTTGIVTVELMIALAWWHKGFLAARRDATQPWAGRVAPLIGSLGVVEVLRAADTLQPGTWSLPGAALLASVAITTLHCAYVDLSEVALRPPPGQVNRQAERDAQLVELIDAWRPASEDFDVATVVTSVVAGRQARGQEIRVRGGGGAAHGRPADLAAVLEELLSNAHRYAARSSVTLHVVEIAGRIELSVSDLGPGMSAADATRALDGGAPDTLTGLRAARALMETSGGRLELRNRIGGTTFVAVLPAARQTAVPASHRDGWAIGI